MLPSVITGMRLGLGVALVIVLAAEFISSTDGNGRLHLGRLAEPPGQPDVRRPDRHGYHRRCPGHRGNMLERLAVPWKQDS
jgi:hypothetical protein